MGLALEMARRASSDGEVPIGCIIVSESGEIIGRGRNRREKLNSALAHAELEAIEAANKALSDWRLSGCSIYITLEPCPMCAGAIIMSRISKVFYGAKEESTGSCGSVLNLFMEPYGHKTEITGGILAKECSALLSDFFKSLR
jgi:tRNA(adenine34) deaminase